MITTIHQTMLPLMVNLYIFETEIKTQRTGDIVITYRISQDKAVHNCECLDCIQN